LLSWLPHPSLAFFAIEGGAFDFAAIELLAITQIRIHVDSTHST